jgi:hypothetical protein
MVNGHIDATTSQPIGLISKSLAWITHPMFADSDPVDWFSFLVLILLAGLLWSKVVRQTLEAI